MYQNIERCSKQAWKDLENSMEMQTLMRAAKGEWVHIETIIKATEFVRTKMNEQKSIGDSMLISRNPLFNTQCV